MSSFLMLLLSANGTPIIPIQQIFRLFQSRAYGYVHFLQTNLSRNVPLYDPSSQRIVTTIGVMLSTWTISGRLLYSSLSTATNWPTDSFSRSTGTKQSSSSLSSRIPPSVIFSAASSATSGCWLCLLALDYDKGERKSNGYKAKIKIINETIF